METTEVCRLVMYFVCVVHRVSRSTDSVPWAECRPLPLPQAREGAAAAALPQVAAAGGNIKAAPDDTSEYLPASVLQRLGPVETRVRRLHPAPHASGGASYGGCLETAVPHETIHVCAERRSLAPGRPSATPSVPRQISAHSDHRAELTFFEQGAATPSLASCCCTDSNGPAGSFKRYSSVFSLASPPDRVL